MFTMVPQGLPEPRVIPTCREILPGLPDYQRTNVYRAD